MDTRDHEKSTIKSQSLYFIPDQEKAEIFTQAGTQTRLPAHAVEKDWWVVQALEALFTLPIAEHLVFKGGTSLSKGWNLIERFSEDIDLAIDRAYFGFEGELNAKEITRLRKAAGSFVDNDLLAGLRAKMNEWGFDKITLEVEAGERSDRDRTILLHYPNVISSPGYLQPRVKIEFSCRSLLEPFTIRSFSAIVDEVFPEASFVEKPIKVPVVNPERTMLEKIFLLHEEFQKPVERIRKGDRLSRHLYDTVKLSTTEHAAVALQNEELYQTIVAHRSRFNVITGVDYAGHTPAQIRIIPPEAVIADWEADYKVMMEEMIYGEQKPSFQDLHSGLTTLQNRINALDWKIGEASANDTAPQ